MCGRFTLRTSPQELAQFFNLLRTPDWKPRYNIAPTQPILAIRSANGGRDSALLHWGLIPSWSKDPKMGARMINARAETVASKPSFRAAFRRRRCLIPADGFYEWKKGRGKTKQPFYICRQDGLPFAFAGLWEQWAAPDGAEIDSCTIVTTEPNELLRELHDRMPVILDDRAYDDWMEPDGEETEPLQRLLVPCPADELKFFPVDTAVNNPRNDAASLIEPAGASQDLFTE